MGKYSLAAQRGFFPQPVYIIGTYKEDGAPNFSIITWITFCSVTPPLIMIASRGSKLTKMLIEKNGVFSANLATKQMIHMTDYFGNTTGQNVDKCKELGIQYIKGKRCNVPVLEASPWSYECSVIDAYEQGDGNIYIAEVKNIQVDDSFHETDYGKINLTAMNPLIYAPGYYYGVTEAIEKVGFTKK